MVKYFTISLKLSPNNSQAIYSLPFTLSLLSLSIFSPSQPEPSLTKHGGATHWPTQPNSDATHRPEPLTDRSYPPAAPPTFGATIDWLPLLPPLISLTKSIELLVAVPILLWSCWQRLGFLMVALILLVAVLILLPLDLLGCWIFILDSLFVDFLFRFLIWFYGWFSFSDMDLWVVDGCFLGGWWWFDGWWLMVVFLVVGGSFLKLWWWLVVVLMDVFWMVGGDSNGSWVFG